MAKLFTGDRIAPVWLTACRSLHAENDRTALNYVLEITNPSELLPPDQIIYDTVDLALRTHTQDLALATVAGTIFPDRMYRKHGRPGFYEHYLDAIRRGKKKGTWGTYAWRLMERRDPRTDQMFNPLERVVRKLRAAQNGAEWKAVYELGTLQPEDMVASEAGGPWCEVPISGPASRPNRNLPCMSHLSVKLFDQRVHVTAFYRAHSYAARALGNLVGISRLQSFLARESGFGIGTLTCISSLANLDVEAFGGARATTALLNGLPP